MLKNLKEYLNEYDTSLKKGAIKKVQNYSRFLRGFLKKAENSLVASRSLLDLQGSSRAKALLKIDESQQYNEWICITSYYSMLQNSKALLSTVDISSEDHLAIICAIAKHFVETNKKMEKIIEIMDGIRKKLASKYIVFLHEEFDKSKAARYKSDSMFTLGEASESLKRAQEFAQETRKYLMQEGALK